MDEQDITHKSATAQKEEATLEFWKEKKIFERSVETPAGGAPKDEFVFFDGPPFATGLPHHGHLLPNTIKDVIPRYKSMQGYRVERKWGWDCHGLPVENLIEKELGLKTKKDIEEYGIEKFNEAAKNSVLRYADDWRRIIPRSGRWVDMESDYRTMDWTYTESVWWVWKQLTEKGLVSEGHKAMHLCPRCETTLANFEVNQGYKDITDISVIVEFEVVGKEKTYLLAWTTTPWTLPGNVALAVNPEVEYVEASGEEAGNTYILARARFEKTFGESGKIVREFSGKELIGLAYKPLFDYYAAKEDLKNKENGWKVYGADFVTTDDGTGIVHIAPAFGDDDMKLGKANSLPFVQHVRTDGSMKPEVTDFAGLQAKPKDDHQSTDVAVIKYLAGKGVLFSKEKIVHSYPHCWRCDTPLLNYAATSWFVEVPKIKEQLLANNQKTTWVPENLRDGRFGNWLEGARDWAVSRSRFWGAPLPVWRCRACEATRTVGSVDEIKAPIRNRYVVMRHGGAVHNVKNIISARPENKHHLTEEGKAEVRKAARHLKGIDLIVSSDFVRTRETAEMVREELGLPKEALVFDERLREQDFGVFEGQSVEEYRAAFADVSKKFAEKCEGGESLSDVKRRVGELLFELDRAHEGKTILVVSHEYPIWMLFVAAEGADTRHAATVRGKVEDFIATGASRELAFRQFPHNRNFEMDLHRPYIDEVALPCECGGEMKRVPEVFDCWFESGAMPYGQIHYPFENKNKFVMPADFIAEGLDQTRGWFYSLMVLSTALFDKPTFKHLVVNGLVLGADGQKMSKRLKNYPELGHVFDRYGADALRLFLLGTPLVRAEEVAMSEKNIDEVSKKIILRMENALQLYQLGVEENGEMEASNVSEHALDLWILARLRELGREVSRGLNRYEIDAATRPFFSFVDDFSTWYLRRSRERLKSAGDEDTRRALQTTRYVFREFSKLIAPFAPFLAERVFAAVRSADEPESVHLCAWPKDLDVHADDEAMIEKMARTRQLVESALALRQKAGMKVRQPLAKLSVPPALSDVFADLVTDELNVKKLEVNEKLEAPELDTELTDELRREGQLRDLMRLVQDARKTAGMSVGGRAVVTLPVQHRTLVEGMLEQFMSSVGAESVLFDDIETVNVTPHS